MHDAGRGWGGRRIGGPRGGRRRRPRCSRASVRTRRGPSAAGVCRCHQGDDACPWRPWGCTTRDCEGAHKSALTDVSLSPVARVTHGFHPRAAGTHNGGSPTDASPSQPDTKKCIQVGRETYAVTSQPGTSYSSPDYDSILVIDSSSPSVPVHSPPTVGKPKKKRTGTENTHKHSHKF